MKKLFNLLLLSFILTACTKSADPLPNDQEYYPMELGLYWEYQMEEIKFNLLGVDTLRYQIKEIVSDSLFSGQDPTYVVSRASRFDSSEEWKEDSVYTVRITKSNAIVTENNVAYSRLSFPVVIGSSWNGNAFNTFNVTNYTYLVPTSTLSQLELEGLIQVRLANIPKNLVNQDQRFQIYANGVGLVEKNYIRLNFITSGFNLGEIESGRLLKQYLINYGKE